MTAHPRHLVALAAIGTLAACGQDISLDNAEPQIQVSLSTLDFGAVNLQAPASLTVEVQNIGTGYLHISGIEFTPDTDVSVFEHSDAPEYVGTTEPASFQVTFIPSDETAFSGGVRIRSDSIEDSVLDIPIAGTGAVPDLGVDPRSLYFSASGAVEQTVTLSSEGSGTVLVQQIDLFDDDGVFGVDLVQGYVVPFELGPGTSVELTVTYDPGGDAHFGEVVITSNDLETPETTIDLQGSGAPPDEGHPPEVRITAPDSGSTFHAGDSVTLEGVVEDPDEPAGNLLVVWKDNGTNVAGCGGFAAGDGTTTCTIASLAPGEHTLVLKVTDSADNAAQDEIGVLIWEDDDTFEYVISGGDTEYDYFSVDDDIAIYLNGVYAAGEDDDDQNSLGPIHIFARPGDALTLQVEDHYACTKRIDALTLYLKGTNASQPLNEAVWVTACPPDDEVMPDCDALDEPDWAGWEGACYQADYYGPWPNTFLDQTFTISVP